ncbi:phage tail protein [Pseudoalteromonas sp. MelDa3]|uniref:phage tail-collar fiber domain-containing protein n=1 Tax=Pseudoalteromonas sp. MelDa3 TaxID=888435 RepID=UPI000CC91807|nr:phage tail protein [Pseudoalteromonas sp. MelDa3]PLT27068.1 hypothetical protein CXF89_02195 [Pseudoalteromonas sp. MelDa3]
MASVITIAGEKLFAAKAQANEQLDIDTFIFANVPAQDPAAPINRDELLPADHVVHQQIVQQVGRINENVVVYSTVLDSVTGPFEFNWVGLYSSVNQTLVAINHIPTTAKTITEPGAAGNTLNRNFGIEYSGIADLTGIDVAPETWQLDFTARLQGMDKLTQQLAKDLNGADSFIDDGFKVVPRSTLNSFEVTAGVGYISGLRVELKEVTYLNASEYPRYVYADAYFEGDASSTWAPKVDIYTSNVEKDDFTDEQGREHYLAPVAIIHNNNKVEDLRFSFTDDKDSTTKNFKTVADYKTYKKVLPIGKVIYLEDRQASFKVVDGIIEANGFWIIANNYSLQSIKLANVGITTPRMFGAIPNEESEAANNEAALLAAIGYGAVSIDEEYYSTLTSNNIIETNIDIIGNRTGGIRFTEPGGPWIRYKNGEHIKISDIKITGAGGGISIFLSPVSEKHLLGQLDVYRCEIKNDVSIHRGTYSSEIDVLSEAYGIKTVNFIKNEVVNCGFSFFTGLNMGHDLVTLKDNIFRNMSFVVMSMGIDNNHDFMENMKKGMKKLICKGNELINDDDYYSPSTGNYLAFVLYEGTEVDYKENWVEGLKTAGVMAVYDIYASVEILRYNGNTNKNNLCFNKDKNNNELLKSKGGKKTYYHNNEFIVEKEFLARHFADDVEKGWVTFYQKTHGDDESELSIKDNNFNIHILRGQPASSNTKSLLIKGNTFKVGKMSSSFAVINNTNEDVYSYSDATVEISDNELNIESLTEVAGLNGFSFLRQVIDQNSPRGDYKSIVLNNNKINIQKAKESVIFLTSLKAGKLEVTDNKLSVDNLDGGTFMPLEYFSCSANEFIYKQNVFHLRNGIPRGTGMNMKLVDSDYIDIDVVYKGVFAPFEVRTPKTEDKPYFLEFAMEATKGGEKYTSNYRVSVDVDGYTYTPVGGVETFSEYPNSSLEVITDTIALSILDKSMTSVGFTSYNRTDFEEALLIKGECSEVVKGVDAGEFRTKVKIVK